MTALVTATAPAPAPVVERLIDHPATRVERLLQLALGAAVTIEEANGRRDATSAAAEPLIESIKSDFRLVTSAPFDEVRTRLMLAMLLGAYQSGRKFNDEIWEDSCVMLLREASFAPPIIAAAGKRLLKQSEFVPTPAAILRECQKELDRVRKIGFRLRAALEARPPDSSACSQTAIATSGTNSIQTAWLQKGRREAARLLEAEKRPKVRSTA